MDSYRCGRKVKYRFCYWKFDNCNTSRSSAGAGAISNPTMKPGDDLDLLLIAPYDEEDEPTVTAFNGWDCTLQSAIFPAGENGRPNRFM